MIVERLAKMRLQRLVLIERRKKRTAAHKSTAAVDQDLARLMVKIMKCELREEKRNAA